MSWDHIKMYDKNIEVEEDLAHPRFNVCNIDFCNNAIYRVIIHYRWIEYASLVMETTLVLDNLKYQMK